MASALSMTRLEREQFLADVRIGLLSVASADGPPLVAPVWYRYEAGGDIVLHTEPTSVKASLLRAAGQASLCVHREQVPYAYVTVEGPVTFGDATPEERTEMAVRYLGDELGRAFIESSAADSLRVSLTPQRWRTVDYAKLPPAG